MTNPGFASNARLFASQLNAAFAATQAFPATTPSAGDNSTAVATTAYVRSALHSVVPEAFGAVSGAVSDAQKIANVAAFAAAIATMPAAGYILQLSQGTYQVNGRIDVPHGIWILGFGNGTFTGGIAGTRIEQYGSGIDTIHWGPPLGNAGGATSYGGGIDGVQFVSMVDQSNVSPAAGNLNALLSITAGAFATFKNLQFGEVSLPIASTTHYCYKAIAFDPASGPVNCIFQTIHIKGYGQSAFDASASTSGNYQCNIMMVNGGLGDTPLKTSNGFALIIGNGEGTWDQINIEWSIFNASTAGAIFMPSSAGIKFGHLHMEGLQLSSGVASTRGAFILVGGAGIVRFDSIHMISTNLPTGCNIVSAGIFAFGFSGSFANISVGQVLVSQTLALGSGVNFYFVNTYEGSGAGTTTNCQVDFVGPNLFFGDGTFASKLTGWSDCNFTAANRGPANGLGRPPTNLGGGTLTITSASPGYSAGTYTQTNYDGVSTYIWNQATNGTINFAQTIDPLLPVSTPMFPNVVYRVVNVTAANTVALHNADTSNILTAASLAARTWADIVFVDSTNKWTEIGNGPLA